MRPLRILIMMGTVFLIALTAHSQDAATVPASPQTEPAKPKVVRMSSAAAQGLVLKKAMPSVPRNHPSGAVEVHVLIGTDGSVKTANAISGPIQLWNATLEAVRQWKYKPYLLNGEAVEIDTTVVVNYTYQ